MAAPIISALQALANQGLTPPAPSDLRFDPARLNVPGLRIPAFLSRYIWERLSACSGQEDFGLRAAQHTAPHQLFGLPYLMQLESSRMAALEVLLRYGRLVANHMEVSLTQEGDCARLMLLPVNNLHLADSECDYWIARYIHILNTPQPERPVILEAHFQRSSPANPAPWKALAGAPVRFSSGYGALWLDVEALHEPRQSGSATVLEALYQALEGYEANLPEQSLLEKVADLILANLHQDIGQERIADLLHMTPRTLHRALKRDGWSYREIVDTSRQFLSYDLLVRTMGDPGAVADLLGYNELSSFHRAFERWHGTPR